MPDRPANGNERSIKHTIIVVVTFVIINSSIISIRQWMREGRGANAGEEVHYNQLCVCVEELTDMRDERRQLTLQWTLQKPIQF